MNEYLTSSEVAKYLKISILQVKELRKSHNLPFVKIGSQIRYIKSSVDEFLKKCERGVNDSKCG